MFDYFWLDNWKFVWSTRGTYVAFLSWWCSFRDDVGSFVLIDCDLVNDCTWSSIVLYDNYCWLEMGLLSMTLWQLKRSFLPLGRLVVCVHLGMVWDDIILAKANLLWPLFGSVSARCVPVFPATLMWAWESPISYHLLKTQVSQPPPGGAEPRNGLCLRFEPEGFVRHAAAE